MNKHLRLFTLIGLAVFLGIWVGTLYYQASVYGEAASTAEFGDKFGAVNALFSGLAFVGVVYAILLQHEELKESTRHLKTSAAALRMQVELAADTARLQVLPTLIDVQKQLVATHGEELFLGFADGTYGPDFLKHRIQLLHEEIQNETKNVQAKETLFDVLQQAGYDVDTFLKAQADIEKVKRGAYLAKIVIGPMRQLLAYTEELDVVYAKVKSTSLPP